MNIEYLRSFRLKFNKIDGTGIAMFDLIGTFFIAYLFQNYATSKFHITKLTYYLSLIPLGIIIHIITAQHTFLNKQLFNSNINIYKIIVIIITILFLLSLQNEKVY